MKTVRSWLGAGALSGLACFLLTGCATGSAGSIAQGAITFSDASAPESSTPTGSALSLSPLATGRGDLLATTGNAELPYDAAFLSTTPALASQATTAVAGAAAVAPGALGAVASSVATVAPPPVATLPATATTLATTGVMLAPTAATGAATSPSSSVISALLATAAIQQQKPRMCGPLKLSC